MSIPIQVLLFISAYILVGTLALMLFRIIVAKMDNSKLTLNDVFNDDCAVIIFLWPVLISVFICCMILDRFGDIELVKPKKIKDK